MQNHSEEEPRHTRRSWLAGAAAAIGAVFASQLSSVATVHAADGEPLLLGEDNTASTPTKLTGLGDGTGPAALNVADTGTSGTAIDGTAAGIGVRGKGITGVAGASTSPNGSGVLGEDLTQSATGRGVQGISHSGWGVFAVSDGQALRVDGRATFSRAGMVSVSYPSKKVTVPVSGAIGVATAFPERPTIAIAVMQTDLPGVWVRAAVLNPTDRTLTIHLNRAPGSETRPRSVNVGWWLAN